MVSSLREMSFSFWRNLKQIVSEKLTDYLKYFDPDYRGEDIAFESQLLRDYGPMDNVSYVLEMQLINFRNNLDQLNDVIVELTKSLNQVKVENLILKDNVTQEVIQHLMHYRHLTYLTTNPRIKVSSDGNQVTIEGSKTIGTNTNNSEDEGASGPTQLIFSTQNEDNDSPSPSMVPDLKEADC